jgi:nitrate reductase delta subunit
MKDNRYSLRALALLLGYPDAALRSEPARAAGGHRPRSRAPEARRRAARLGTPTCLRQDAMDVEARYVETFDRGHATSLHLFEHVHGDSRDRGPAMVDLVQTYEKAGLYLAPEELPDHLCVVLEFASTQPPKLAD